MNDPLFNVKIARRKEFFNSKFDGTIHNIKEQANILCNAEFELMPHQMFVKNFLSFQTPYNSLLLYHGLGTGKTCSAIGISEEMRNYMKQIGIKQRIIVVASPNVQTNFRLQLFDERKLKKTSLSQAPEDVTWNMNTCIGNSLLQEINPVNLKGLTKDKIVSQINTIINNYYVFMGYGQLANHINDKLKTPDDISEKERTEMEIKNIRRNFNNRLIIIDEVHNIRLADENNNKKTAMLLMKIAKYCDNLRFLFLSATPMYNSYKEIVWITNLMNLNDNRSIIDANDIFDKEGVFKEGGKQLLKKKITGYVSYVRGENPYVFPYRIYPKSFSPEHTFQSYKYPIVQMNRKPIEEPLKNINVYLNKSGEYQNQTYNIIIENLRKKSMNSYNIHGEMKEMPTFENMDTFGYLLLQTPLECLNISYPNAEMDLLHESYTETTNTRSIEEENNVITKSVGKNGLQQIVKYTESYKPVHQRHNFEYTSDALKNYGPIFNKDNIGKYSSKIANILDSIEKSTGIVLIYSQYIDGGIIPISLALEERGFSRYCSQASHNKNLFKQNRTESIDARTFKPRSLVVAEGGEFRPAKYMIITGEKNISPSNGGDIKYATNTENRYGENVKVILISKAGAEGLDFKNIRQVHILEPWYNMNRIEQIIGRGVRSLSHCSLPFEERNVEIYLHSTITDGDEEAADLYVYRLAEKKAIQIGRVTRLLKESSVDCILNIGQTNFSVEKLMQLAANQNIELILSSGKRIIHKIGDEPFSDICDYSETCEYKCDPSEEINETNLIEETYNDDFVKMNKSILVEKIKYLFSEHTSYKREVLINSINIVKQYPIEHIYYALTYLIDNKNEFIIDKYGRQGNLINKGDIYVFQPIEISEENASLFERTVPVEYKRNEIYLEAPKQIQKEDTNKAPLVSANIPVVKENEKKDLSGILKSIKERFDIVFNTPALKIPTGEKNWYKHANKVIEHLLIVYEIPAKSLRKYVIQHILDMMLLEDKLILIQYFFSGSQINDENDDIKENIKGYFNERLVEEGGKQAFVLNKENSWKLFVEPEWKEGEPEDYRFFEKELDRFDVDDAKIANIVGFINMFKQKDMVFKIKDIRQARNNTGARCGDSTTKTDVIKLINGFLEKPMYDNKTEFLHYGLCVIIEILMRYFTEIKKKGLVYFLSPEQTAINDIVHFSRST